MKDLQGHILLLCLCLIYDLGVCLVIDSEIIRLEPYIIYIYITDVKYANGIFSQLSMKILIRSAAFRHVVPRASGGRSKKKLAPPLRVYNTRNMRIDLYEPFRF